MSEWIYDGYTKVHNNSRKHMIERWVYRCSECGHTVRTEPTRRAILSYATCPSCGADMKGADDEYEPIKDYTERKRIFALIERCKKEQRMSKKKPCGLDYCPQEEIVGVYASCTACAWGNDGDDESEGIDNGTD